MLAVWIWTTGLGMAALALAAALWALFWDRPQGRLRCPKCWYDLTGITAPVTCSECGRRITTRRQMRRTRRRWRVALAALLGAGAMGWAAPVWATKGWIAAVPQPALDVVIHVSFAERASQTVLVTAPATQWEAALASWEIRRRLAALPELERQADADAPFGAKWLSVEGEAYQLARIAQSFCWSQPSHLRRGLSGAFAQAAVECQSVRIRSEFLDHLAGSPDRSSRAADPLWDLAGRLDQLGLAKKLVVALTEVDPAFPQRSDTDACLRWFERALRQNELAPRVWREMVEATVRFDVGGVEVVEREIWRRPKQDLAAAVRILDQSGEFARSRPQHRTLIYAAVCRLSEHPDVDVRRACVAALIGNKEIAGVVDALRQMADDEDPWVAELASEAVQPVPGG